MVSRLKQKVALIAGAGDPVGRGIALRFAKEGALVALVDTNPEAAGIAEQLRQANARSVFIAADTSIKADAERAVSSVVKQLGGIQVLVNNTLGTCAMGPLEKKSETAVAQGMKGLFAAMWLSQAAFPHMQRQKWGRIINIGSRYGERMNVYNAEYNMAAWGLRGLTRTTAAEWGKHNVVANVLEIAADTEEFAAYRHAAPEIVDALVEQVAMGRRGDPEEDIGAAAAFLACDEVDCITGQVVYADGGQHLAAPAFVPAAQLGFLIPPQEGIYEYE